MSVSADVGDNLNGWLIAFLGYGKENNTPDNYGGSVVERLNYLEARQAENTDQIDSMSEKIDTLKVDVGVSAAQTYITLLSDYQANGTASAVYNDKTQWDALCRSSVMHCSQKYSGEALDYYLENSLPLNDFFKDMGYDAASIESLDDVRANFDTIKANELCMYSMCNSRFTQKYFYADTATRGYLLAKVNATYLQASRFAKHRVEKSEYDGGSIVLGEVCYVYGSGYCDRDNDKIGGYDGFYSILAPSTYHNHSYGYHYLVDVWCYPVANFL